MKKKNNTDYQKVIEPERYYKEQNWKIAIGLQEVDGLKPTEYLKSLAQENIDGKKTIYEVQEELKKVELNEADIVSAKIVEFLDDPSFIFDPIFLEKIHEFLFKDIYDFA
ncbi:MAG: hypothetical protein LBU14_06110 [Candidatus Peribacteria bacterium]|jgi:fido (protein-threonine AMPylation protein)|nr:hypothetical protein [Candidatus Peribacteria bacterium]